MLRSEIMRESIRRDPIHGQATEFLKLTYTAFVIAPLHVGVVTQGCFGIGPVPTVLNRSDVVVSLRDAQIVTVRIEERVNLFPWRWTARPEPVGDIILRIAEYKPSRDRKYENPTHVRLPRPQYEDSGQTCTGYSRHPRPTDIANLSPLVRLRTLQIRREE